MEISHTVSTNCDSKRDFVNTDVEILLQENNSFTEYANMLSQYDKLDETCEEIIFYTERQSIGYVITRGRGK